MPLQKVAAAREWMLRARRMKSSIRTEMSRRLRLIEQALRNGSEPPLDDAREWARFHELEKSTMTSIFFAHLDAIGHAYQQMLEQQARKEKKKR